MKNEHNAESKIKVQALAKTNPVAAARLCQAEVRNDAETAHKRARRRMIEGYAAAYHLFRKKEDWSEFLADEFWNQRKKKPTRAHLKEECLRTVYVFVFQAIEKSAYDRAYKYAVALDKEFKNGVEPERVGAIIDANKGIEAMIEKRLRGKKEGSAGRALTPQENSSWVKASVRLSKKAHTKLSSLKAGRALTVRFKHHDDGKVIGKLPKTNPTPAAADQHDDSGK